MSNSRNQNPYGSTHSHQNQSYSGSQANYPRDSRRASANTSKRQANLSSQTWDNQAGVSYSRESSSGSYQNYHTQINYDAQSRGQVSQRQASNQRRSSQSLRNDSYAEGPSRYTEAQNDIYYQQDNSRSGKRSKSKRSKKKDNNQLATDARGVVPYSGAEKGKKSKKKTGKKSTAGKIILAVIIALVVILAGAGLAAARYIMSINSSLSFDNEEAEELAAALSDTTKPSDPFWMLLLGTDEDTGTTRADTIILAYINPEDLSAALISIPRDTRVEIPGYWTDKINAAHAYGGPSLMVETVSQFAGVPISHYAELDFGGFYDLVDELGGVEVDVPVYVTATDSEGVPLWAANGEELHDLQPGLQTLDGSGALVFCRSRYYDTGDYQRQANQRIFLKAMADKILNSDLNTIIKAAKAIGEAVTTDMSIGDITEIAQNLRGMNMDDIFCYGTPSSTDMIDGISYVIADQAALQELVSAIQSGNYPAEDNSNVEVGSYANTTSTDATEASEGEGDTGGFYEE